MNLSEIEGSLKRGLKGEKNGMKHLQTVARPHNGTPGCWATVLVCIYQFLLQILILNNTKSSKLPISINFTNPLRKTIYLQL